MQSRQEYEYSHFGNVRVGGDQTVTGNGVDLRSAVTTATPAIAAVGDDANVGLNLLTKGTGVVTIIGDEANAAGLRLYADQGDDTADRWTIQALAGSAALAITNGATTSSLAFAEGGIVITGAEAGNAAIVLDADEGDDNADTWTIQATAADNDLDFVNHTTTVATLTSAGVFTATGLASSGAIASTSGTAGIGYATGAGGVVTQDTSKSTAVTLAKVSGAITTSNAALNDATNVVFTVTATGAVDANDNVVVNHISGGTLGAYQVWAHSVAANEYKISIRNVSGGNLSEALVLQIGVIKGVAA
jgi:hypothetical protein